MGSGLGDYAEQIKIETTIDYKDIKGFPTSTVPGHKGRFVFGYVDSVPVVIMQGRVHYYEGNTHVAPQAVVLESRSNMQNFVPSVIGMGAKDAVYLLESKGLKVNLVGVGKVKSQSIANGTIVKKGQTVTLTLK